MSEVKIADRKTKIVYIDYLRVVLTVLVILHHAAITYGAPGGWYYSQKSDLIGFLLPFTVFVSVNQAFFMGFFFFLSALFIPGSKWLELADYKLGKQMRTIALCLIVIGFPLFFVVRRILDFPVAYYNSGGHWQSLWYALWEQLVGFSIVAALICIGKSRWNRPSTLLNNLARSTFAAYIFHPLILIALSVLMHDQPLEPGIKFLIVGPMAVIGSFLLAMLLVKIPVVDKVI